MFNRVGRIVCPFRECWKSTSVARLTKVKKILYCEYTTVKDTKYCTIIDMDSQILLIKWHRENIHQKVLRITGRVSRVVKARESFSPSYSALFPFGELRQVMFAAANLILIPLKECKTSRMYNISSGFSFLSFSILWRKRFISVAVSWGYWSKNPFQNSKHCQGYQYT